MITACMACLTYSLIKQRPAAIAPVILFFTLGWVAIAAFVPPAFPPASVLPFLDKDPHKLSGTICLPPVKQGFRTRCVLDDLVIYADNDTQAPLALPGRIQVTVYGDAPELAPGARMTIHRPIRSIRNFNNPGGFNYRQFMAYRNIWGTAWDRGDRIAVDGHAYSGSFSLSVLRMRLSIDHAIESVSDGDTRAILAALIIGKRDFISPGLRSSFSKAGVSHLLAISGLHVGIIATVSFFLATALLGRNIFLLRRGLVRKTAAILSMLCILGYGMIAGMSPSTQRAVIMISIFLFAYVFDRQYNPANTLAAAALGILAISPPSLFDISFQLSFAAVAAILMGLHWVPVVPKAPGGSWRNRLLRTVAGFAWVSVLAIIGTMPLVAHYFNQVTFLGIGANLILVPLIGFVVVPLGLASALFYFIYAPVGLLGLSITDHLLSVALVVVDRIAALPFGSYSTVTPSILEMACIYTLLTSIPALLYAMKTGHTPSPAGAHAPLRDAHRIPARSKKIIAIAAVIAILVLLLDGAYWVHRRHWNTDLVVTYLDVGQGNAALVEMPGGKTMLVDGGGFSDNAAFDVGALIVAPFLWRNKIRSIDKIVLSHPHADHLNGLLYIMENFSIGRVISTHYPADSNNYARFLNIMEEKGIPHPPFSDIPASQTINGIQMDIFYPPRDRLPGIGPANINNGSIVLKLTHGDVSFLFPGDIEAAAEAELVGIAGDMLYADFLLSPHHGSSTSSTLPFLDAVNPQTVIVSARSDRFGFPSKDVVDRYIQRGYAVLTTETHGAVQIAVKNNAVRIRPTRPVNRQPQTILVE